MLDISSCLRVCPVPGRGRGQAAGVCVGPQEGSREPGVRKAAVSLYVHGALGLQPHAGWLKLHC